MKTINLILKDHISIAAYYLWKARGCGHGHDKDDWYAAEILLSCPPDLHSKLYPPTYSYVGAEVVATNRIVSHAGFRNFLVPSNTWIEARTDPQTIFECDRNRRLHFNEGFLCTCYRVFKDESVSSIARNHHFPFKDLRKFRQKIDNFKSIYERGEDLPPPLFYCPAPYELEILDGVHRCLAAFDLARSGGFALTRAEEGGLKICVGFNRDAIGLDTLVHQLWIGAIGHMREHQNPNLDTEVNNGILSPSK